MARFMIDASNGLRNNSGNTVMMSMRIGLFFLLAKISLFRIHYALTMGYSRFSFYHFRPTHLQKNAIANALHSSNTHKSKC
jgi:hypothetical protein